MQTKVLAILICLIAYAELWSSKPAYAQQVKEEPTLTAAVGSNGSNSDSASTASVLEERIARVEFSERLFERQVSQFTWVVSLASGFVVALAVLATFIFGRSLNNARDEIEKTIGALVSQELLNKSGKGQEFEALAEGLTQANDRYEEIQESLANLEKFKQLVESAPDDPFFSYMEAGKIEEKVRLSTFDKKTVDKDERQLALGHLRNVIEIGLRGNVDPNVLFNSCIVANRMNFDDESLKLAALANYYGPCPSHEVLVADLEHTLGSSFRVKGEGFAPNSSSPKQLRSEAMHTVAKEVLRVPRAQCEQVYSRANNIGVRDRELGALKYFIQATELSAGYTSTYSMLEEDLLEFNESQNKLGRPSITSSGLVNLADFYAMDGEPGWRKKYLLYTGEAIKLLSTESRMATWFDRSIRNIKKTAERLNAEDEVREIAIQIGFNIFDYETDEERARRQFEEFQEAINQARV